jgi:hypothetical protein
VQAQEEDQVDHQEWFIEAVNEVWDKERKINKDYLYDQAFLKAGKQHPRLYQNYLREVQGRGAAEVRQFAEEPTTGHDAQQAFLEKVDAVYQKEREISPSYSYGDAFSLAGKRYSRLANAYLQAVRGQHPE